MSPRPGPRRNNVTTRLSTDEGAVLDQWAEQLGFTNHQGEPNRSAVLQWLVTPPAKTQIDRTIKNTIAKREKNGDQK